MPSRKQPEPLLRLATTSVLTIINEACDRIDVYASSSQEAEDILRKEKLDALRDFLHSCLPVCVFEMLCAEPRRHATTSRLSILMHPSMTFFCRSTADLVHPAHFWINSFASMKELRVLNLNQICTDEVLKVVGENCSELVELNAISEIQVKKETSFVTRVTDEGLLCILKLHRLTKLAIDTPIKECGLARISETGMRQVVFGLPFLKQIFIPDCNLGAALLENPDLSRPLILTKMSYFVKTTNKIMRLLTLCPLVDDLYLTITAQRFINSTLRLLAKSDVRLTRLKLSYYGYSKYAQLLFKAKGAHITDLSITAIIDFDGLLSIGNNCPNIKKLLFCSASDKLEVPCKFKVKTGIMFHLLEDLTLTCGKGFVENLLFFFLSHSTCLSILSVEESSVNIDVIASKLLARGLLSNVVDLQLNCNISCSTITRIIDECPVLSIFSLPFPICTVEQLHHYILANHYDVELKRIQPKAPEFIYLVLGMIKSGIMKPWSAERIHMNWIE